MRIMLLLMILSIPPLIAAASASIPPAAETPAATAVEARAATLGMVPVVEILLIAGFALSRRERRRLEDAELATPARAGRRPRRGLLSPIVH